MLKVMLLILGMIGLGALIIALSLIAFYIILGLVKSIKDSLKR